MGTDISEPKTSVAPAPSRSFTEQLIEPFSRLRGEIDRLFDEFPARWPRMQFAADFAIAAPALEMTETKTAYKVTAELPGIEPEAVEVSVEGDLLRIAGEKKSEREEDEKGYRISERSFGSFERVVRLPVAAQPEKIKARFRNGVLTITIPKDGKAPPSARKITVERA